MNKNWLPWQLPLPWQRLLRDRKTNFRSFIYSLSSIVFANFVKIGPVDSNRFWQQSLKTAAEHRSLAHLRLVQLNK